MIFISSSTSKINGIAIRKEGVNAMIMQVRGGAVPFAGDDVRSRLDDGRVADQERPSLHACAAVEAAGASPAGETRRDEFIRSGGIKALSERENVQSAQAGESKKKDSGRLIEGTEKDEERAGEDAVKEAAEDRGKKRKHRAEITWMYAEHIPDPSDPHNPHKGRWVYRQGPTYPAPEFGLGGSFDGIF